MIQKVSFFLFSILLIVLLLMANHFLALQYFKFEPQQKSLVIGNAADYFTTVGFTICIFSWLWANVLVVKTKQLFWLSIPFLFTVFVSLVMGWQAEEIFIFNKQNGMWKGGFSLSYFFSLTIIFFITIVLVTNYFILRNFQDKKSDLKN